MNKFMYFVLFLMFIIFALAMVPGIPFWNWMGLVISLSLAERCLKKV